MLYLRLHPYSSVLFNSVDKLWDVSKYSGRKGRVDVGTETLAFISQAGGRYGDQTGSEFHSRTNVQTLRM